MGDHVSPALDDAIVRGVAGDPAWKLLPSWFVYGDADEVIDPALHARLAARAGAVETVVASGGTHELMVSCPGDVLRVIGMAVGATIAQVPDITPD
jgi:pimeloyl-ACP methyl ester carboxylesterase